MIEFLESMHSWHWVILGLILIGLEMMAPGTFLMWPGIAAIVVSLLYIPMPDLQWTGALTIWAILSFVSVVGWISWRKKNPAAPSGDPTLNRRGQQYIGRTVTLTSPIVNGRGEVRIDDTVWRAVADRDFSEGAQVKILAVEGTSLRIG